MKVLVLLLLGLQGCANDCGQDKRLRIIKNDGAHQLDIIQLYASTNSCATPLYLDYTSCDDQSFDYCEEIVEGSADCKMINVSIHSATTSQTSYLTDCSNLNVCEAHSIIESFFSQCARTNVTRCNSEQAKTLEFKPIKTFGSLTGLLLVILVLVITGWMWTCWTLKKKVKETQHCKKCQKQESDSEDERFCLNQIYKMTTTQPVVGTAIEQPLDSLEESGQSINGLSNKDNRGNCGVRRMENLYTSSEGSSHSSLQEEQRVNRVEQGEHGKKHVYHVLEKPEGDDYEELDKTLEEDTVMEYETPVPSNEL